MVARAWLLSAVLVGQLPAASWDRGRLEDAQGHVLFEARRIILDSDSYPRPPGRIVAGPRVERQGSQWQIRFQLDRPDDVSVRIVDSSGRTVHILGCGVVGRNAPAPFQSNSLSQSIVWDGKDASGRPAPDACKVQVSVGVEPRFEGFVGYNPGQLLRQIIWLEVDPLGRVYVQLATGRKSDPVMLRFNRQGEYVDMVYPSNPKSLEAAGKRIEEVWPFVAKYEGEAIPHRPRSWPTFVPYRADSLIPFPMRIASDGTVYFAETTTGYPPWASRDELFRIFRTPMDPFWFLQTMPLMYSIGPFAIDGTGCGYLVTSTAPACTGTYPPTLTSLNDHQAPGTIRKVDLKTGQLRADFEYNGNEKRAAKSAHLGVTQVVSAARGPDRVRPDPESDSDRRFLDVADLTITPSGNILVADGWPRRVKCYEANGRFLGELSGLRADGRQRTFQDLRGIAWHERGFYLLGVFCDQPDKTFLAKCEGDLVEPNATWLIELDPAACHLAVDRAARPPLLWVGMGHGPASLTRISDMGDRAGDLRCIGGIPAKTVLYPWNVAADAEGHLFIHDRDGERLIRTDAAVSQWQEVPLRGAPTSMLVDERNRRLLLSYSLGENGAYSKERLEESGFVCMDLHTLTRLPFRLQSEYTSSELAQRDKLFAERRDAYYPWTKTYGGLLAGVDAEGNFYVRDAARGQSWHKAGPTSKIPCAGVIRKYGPDGSVRDEAVCRLFNTGGGVAMDSHGCFYAVELPQTRWVDVVHNFAAAIGDPSFGKEPRRGGTRILTQSGFTHLVKMDARGGSRNTDAELWAHRGVSCTNGGGCYCDWPDMHVAIDSADRIFVADVDLHMVKILDTAGNMIARIGRWGNAETLPGPDRNARELGFRMIYCLATSGDSLYVSDKDLRRVARIEMAYRETREVSVQQASRH